MHDVTANTDKATKQKKCSGSSNRAASGRVESCRFSRPRATTCVTHRHNAVARYRWYPGRCFGPAGGIAAPAAASGAVVVLEEPSLIFLGFDKRGNRRVTLSPLGEETAMPPQPAPGER